MNQRMIQNGKVTHFHHEGQKPSILCSRRPGLKTQRLFIYSHKWERKAANVWLFLLESWLFIWLFSKWCSSSGLKSSIYHQSTDRKLTVNKVKDIAFYFAIISFPFVHCNHVVKICSMSYPPSSFCWLSEFSLLKEKKKTRNNFSEEMMENRSFFGRQLNCDIGSWDLCTGEDGGTVWLDLLIVSVLWLTWMGMRWFNRAARLNFSNCHWTKRIKIW